jgi:hypothetical protein
LTEAQKLQLSKNANKTLLGTLVMTSSFQMTLSVCFKMYQSHDLRRNFETMQVNPTLYKSGCQNQPRLLKIIFLNMPKTCMKKIISVSNKNLCRTFENNLHDFFALSDWPASSADLNLLEYFA